MIKLATSSSASARLEIGDDVTNVSGGDAESFLPEDDDALLHLTDSDAVDYRNEERVTQQHHLVVKF